MAVNWDDVRYVEGLVACLDDVCERRGLPLASHGSADPKVMQFFFDLAELYDVYDKAQAHGDRDQRAAAWTAVEQRIRQFQAARQ